VSNVYDGDDDDDHNFDAVLRRSEKARHAVADHLEACGLNIYFPPFDRNGPDRGDVFIIRDNESGRIEVKNPKPKGGDWTDPVGWRRSNPHGIFLERLDHMCAPYRGRETWESVEAHYIVNRARTHAIIVTTRFTRPFWFVKRKVRYECPQLKRWVCYDMVVCPLDKVMTQFYELRRSPVRPVAGQDIEPALRTSVQLPLTLEP
jgi:hypothetical protein